MEDGKGIVGSILHKIVSNIGKLTAKPAKPYDYIVSIGFKAIRWNLETKDTLARTLTVTANKITAGGQ